MNRTTHNRDQRQLNNHDLVKIAIQGPTVNLNPTGPLPLELGNIRKRQLRWCLLPSMNSVHGNETTIIFRGFKLDMQKWKHA
jgi:hypothetical protein